MKTALTHVLFATAALVVSAVLCLVAFLGSVALSVATGVSIGLPGFFETSAGRDAELASTQFRPTTPLWLVGVALVLYASMIVSGRLRRTSGPES